MPFQKVGKKNKKIFYGDINNKINIKKKYDYITLFGVFWFMLANFHKSYKNLKLISKKNSIFFFSLIYQMIIIYLKKQLKMTKIFSNFLKNILKF